MGVREKQVSGITWWVIGRDPTSVWIVWQLVIKTRLNYSWCRVRYYVHNNRSSSFPPKHWDTMTHRNQTHHRYCSTILIRTLQHRSVSVWDQPVQGVKKTNSLILQLLIFIESVDSKAKERSTCLSQSQQKNIWQPWRRLPLIFKEKPPDCFFSEWMWSYEVLC